MQALFADYSLIVAISFVCMVDSRPHKRVSKTDKHQDFCGEKVMPIERNNRALLFRRPQQQFKKH
jgi:hypothetical protein